MPRDLFEDSTSESNSSQPKDLFAGQENPGMSNTEGAVRHILASGAQFGKNLLNTPNKIYSKIPAFGEKILPQNPYDVYGVKENLADKVGVGIADFAPYLTGAGGLMKGGAMLAPRVGNLLSKAPNLAKNVIAGGAYGGVNAPEGDRLKDTAIGAGLGGISAGLGYGVDKLLLQPLAKGYIQSAVPALIKRATSSVKDLPAPEVGANMLKGNLTKAAAQNTANWTNTSKLATTLDTELGANKSIFDASPYTKHIDDYISKIESYTPAKKAQYMEALDFAKEIKELAPKNFEDVTLLRQNLNQTLGDFTKKRGLDKADRYAQDFVKDVKDKLINDTLKANADKVNPEAFSEFQKTWEAANKSHQEVQEFYKGVGKTGAIKPKQVIREGLQKAGAPDAAIMTEYMPKAGQTGIEGFKQLEKLLGAKEKAQESIKSYYLRNVAQNGASRQDIASLYGKLSPAQREYVFGTGKEAKLLETTNKALLTMGRPNLKQKLIGHGIGAFVPGAVGFDAGLESGMSWRDAAKLGIGAGLAGSAGRQLAARYATPRSVERMLEFYKNGRKNRGEAINLGLQGLFGRPEQ